MIDQVSTAEERRDAVLLCGEVARLAERESMVYVAKRYRKREGELEALA